MAYMEIPLTGVVPASGSITLTIRPRARQQWTIAQVGIRASGVGPTAKGNITKNGIIVTPFVANGDAPAGEPTILLRTGDRMAAEWTGALAGARVEANFIGDDGT
jgi:hypothetical protein